MAIQEEVKKRKLELEQKEKEKHDLYLKKAKKIIPRIANEVREYAIEYAAKGDGLVYRRFFSFKKFMKFRYGLPHEDSLIVRECPEIINLLVQKISENELKNVSITIDDYIYDCSPSVWIEAEIDLS